MGGVRAPLALRADRVRPRAGGRTPPARSGIAISEAVEVAAQREDTNYALGSVLNHVLLHQTVIGQEAIAQLALADAGPDVIVGCVGGGSNFAGLVFPFLREKLARLRRPAIVAVGAGRVPDPDRAAVYAYDFGDTVGLTPLMQDAHARPRLRAAAAARRRAALPRRRADDQRTRQGGRRSRRARTGRTRRFEAAVQLRAPRASSPRPSPRTRSAARSSEALAAKSEARSARSCSASRGHGHFDLAAYDAYLGGTLEDLEFSSPIRGRARGRCRERRCWS